MELSLTMQMQNGIYCTYVAGIISWQKTVEVLSSKRSE
jgi:hypothetical protein